MRPQEFFLAWETRRPTRPDEYSGRLTEPELEQLYEMIHSGD